MRERRLEFPDSLRRDVKADGICGSCGAETNELQVHHCIPVSYVRRLREMRVSSRTIVSYIEFVRSRSNAVPLCPECHPFWDKLTGKEVFFGIGKIGIEPK